MAESKQRLRPWLENLLNTEAVPGVCWVDLAESKFRIPWKHHGKQQWRKEDGEIFKRWALHTGKFRENIDKEDFALWKTRLRCALNKAPDIEEMKDESNLDDPHPFRIYKLLNKRIKVEGAGEDIVMELQSPARNQFSVPVRVLNPQAQGVQAPSTLEVPQVVEDLESDSKSLTDINSHELIFNPGEEFTSEHMESLPNKSDMVAYIEGTGNQPPPPSGAEPLHVACSAETSQQTPQTSDQGATCMTLSVLHDNVESKSFLIFEAHDEGKELSSPIRLLCPNIPQQTLDQLCKLQIDDENGAGPKRFYGLPGITEIQLERKPGSESNEKIYENLSRGVIIEHEPSGDIYAERFCKLQVFYGSESTDYVPVKLERHTRVKIFSHEGDFKKSVHNFLNLKGKAPEPDPKVHLLFGKHVNKINDQEMAKVHLSAVIVSKKAERLVNSVKDFLTSSSTVDLSALVEDDSILISESDTLDQIQKQVQLGPKLVPVELTPDPQNLPSIVMEDLEEQNDLTFDFLQPLSTSTVCSDD